MCSCFRRYWVNVRHEIGDFQAFLNGSSGEISPSPSRQRPRGVLRILWAVCGHAGPGSIVQVGGGGCDALWVPLSDGAEDSGVGRRWAGQPRGGSARAAVVPLSFTPLCNRRQHVSI